MNLQVSEIFDVTDINIIQDCKIENPIHSIESEFRYLEKLT